MNFHVVVPSHVPHLLFTPLLTHVERVCKEYGITIHEIPEEQCADYVRHQTSVLALVSPLTYAQLALECDMYIIPAPVVLLEGLTYSASMYLKPGVEEFQACVSPTPHDFLIQMGFAMLTEKLDAALVLQKAETTVISDALQNADAVISYGFDAAQDIVLDVSDEWTDMLEAPLPLAFWACRADNDISINLPALVRAFSNEQIIAQEHEVFEKEQHGTTGGRSGKIMFQWNAEVEELLQHTIELLYIRQYIPAIATTKVWQRG